MNETNLTISTKKLSRQLFQQESSCLEISLLCKFPHNVKCHTSGKGCRNHIIISFQQLENYFLKISLSTLTIKDSSGWRTHIFITSFNRSEIFSAKISYKPHSFNVMKIFSRKSGNILLREKSKKSCITSL